MPELPSDSQPSDQPPVTPLTALRVDEQGRLTYMGQDGQRYVILGNGELLHRLKNLDPSSDQD